MFWMLNVTGRTRKQRKTRTFYSNIHQERVLRIYPFDMLQIIFLSKQSINKRCILKFQFHSPLHFVWSHMSPLTNFLLWIKELGHGNWKAFPGLFTEQMPLLCKLIIHFISLSSFTWTFLISFYCFMGLHILIIFIVTVVLWKFLNQYILFKLKTLLVYLFYQSACNSICQLKTGTM